MVSLKTILTIGGIAGAYFLFKSAGGARGIGSSIGGGISGFQSSLVDSLKFQPFPDLFASKYQASEGTAKETIFYDDSFAGANSTFLLSSILFCQIFPSCSGVI